jgi:hypothetical protein
VDEPDATPDQKAGTEDNRLNGAQQGFGGADRGGNRREDGNVLKDSGQTEYSAQQKRDQGYARSIVTGRNVRRVSGARRERFHAWQLS